MSSFLSRPSDGDDAAGLLLRWLDQVARGNALSYRADVADWLERHGEPVHRSQSASAQGILLAEGLVDRERALAQAGVTRTDTFDLVALVKSAQESGSAPADADLRSIADSPRSADYAPRLARTLLARRGS